MGALDRFLQPLTIYLTLWASCLIYLLPLRRRPHALLRPVLFLALALALSLARTLFPPLGGLAGLSLVCLFAFSFQWACADQPWTSALYCAVWTVVTQQLVTEVWLLCYLYGAPHLDLQGGWWLTGVVLFALFYWAAALTLARWMPRDGQYHVGPRQLSSAVVLLVLFEALFWVLVSTPAQTGPYSGLLILSQLYCATMLYLQDALFKKSAMRQEIQTLNRLWYEQKDQYQLARENIAIINRKCHDLKHQVAAMRAMASSEEREKYLREIEDSVRIYDSIVQSGNEVLDTVLTEKSLYCEANHITVNCVADGTALGFMDPVDVYAVLGNALDNAIESVQHFQQAERRTIDVLVCTERQFLVVQVVNPLEAVLTFEDGLPLSTKPHDGYHGFGLKSIRHTVAKYGGFLTVNTEKHCFALKILIPLPK